MAKEKFKFKLDVTQYLEPNDKSLQAYFQSFPKSRLTKLNKACESFVDSLTGGQKRVYNRLDPANVLMKVLFFLKLQKEQYRLAFMDSINDGLNEVFDAFGNEDVYSSDYDTQIKALHDVSTKERDKKIFSDVARWQTLFFDDPEKAIEDMAKLDDGKETADEGEDTPEEKVPTTDTNGNKELRKTIKKLTDQNEKYKANIADLAGKNKTIEKEKNELAKQIELKDSQLSYYSSQQEVLEQTNKELYESQLENERLHADLANLQDDITNNYVPAAEYSKYKDYYDANAEKLREKEELAANEPNLIEAIKSKALQTDMCYSEKDLVNFHIALKTSQLVILAGSSGTGKTQLPFVYTKALNKTEESGNVLFIPITPSYVEPSDILGYFKPNMSGGEASSTGRFMESPTGLVSFLVNASKHPEDIFFVIFDEMNLSQIEYWFSPFMSILERREDNRSISLYSKNNTCENSDEFPPSVPIGKNVFFIGTVNLDETTKDMSDRLSDRAIVINLAKNKFSYYYGEKENSGNKDVVIDNMTGEMFESFIKKNQEYINSFEEKEIQFFDALDEQIRSVNAQKGVSFRTLKTIGNYLSNAAGLESYMSRKEALDYIVKQTILVKINGSDKSISTLLSEDDPKSIIAILDQYNEISDFAITREAIKNKRAELVNYGFTR